MTMTWREAFENLNKLPQIDGLNIIDITIDKKQTQIHVYDSLMPFIEADSLPYEIRLRDSKEYPSMITVEIDGITLFELRGQYEDTRR